MPANAADRLMQHYVDNFRRLPWRSPPGTPPSDPYLVWVSEIMLQQTTVAAVAPRFCRFVARWPTVAALAAAPEAEVMSEWAGLGYYARARNMAACARAVAERGAFPRTAAGLRKLPGIGAYTAAAIAAIAFGERIVPVDTNVARIVARLHGLDRAGRADVERRANSFLAGADPASFAQALMDLGATVCRPRAPLCGSCPLSGDCLAYASGEPEQFPKPEPRRARPLRSGIAWWIERDGQVWLVRRPARGLLGGMAALPGADWVDGPLAAGQASLGTVRHVFTHFTLDLALERSTEAVGEGWWQPLDALGDAGLPTLYRRAAELVLAASAAPVQRLEEPLASP